MAAALAGGAGGTAATEATAGGVADVVGSALAEGGRHGGPQSVAAWQAACDAMAGAGREEVEECAWEVQHHLHAAAAGVHTHAGVAAAVEGSSDVFDAIARAAAAFAADVNLREVIMMAASRAAAPAQSVGAGVLVLQQVATVAQRAPAARRKLAPANWIDCCRVVVRVCLTAGDGAVARCAASGAAPEVAALGTLIGAAVSSVCHLVSGALAPPVPPAATAAAGGSGDGDVGTPDDVYACEVHAVQAALAVARLVTRGLVAAPAAASDETVVGWGHALARSLSGLPGLASGAALAGAISTRAQYGVGSPLGRPGGSRNSGGGGADDVWVDGAGATDRLAAVAWHRGPASTDYVRPRRPGARTRRRSRDDEHDGGGDDDDDEDEEEEEEEDDGGDNAGGGRGGKVPLVRFRVTEADTSVLRSSLAHVLLLLDDALAHSSCRGAERRVADGEQEGVRWWHSPSAFVTAPGARRPPPTDTVPLVPCVYAPGFWLSERAPLVHQLLAEAAADVAGAGSDGDMIVREVDGGDSGSGSGGAGVAVGAAPTIRAAVAAAVLAQLTAAAACVAPGTWRLARTDLVPPVHNWYGGGGSGGRGVAAAAAAMAEARGEGAGSRATGPLELRMLQALLSLLVRCPSAAVRNTGYRAFTTLFKCLSPPTGAALAALLVESCPFPAVAGLVVDTARGALSADLRRASGASVWTPAMLGRLLAAAVTSRMALGLLAPANLRATVAATTRGGADTGRPPPIDLDRQAPYLESVAELDLAIAAAARFVLGSGVGGRAGCDEAHTGISRSAWGELRDMYFRPLLTAVADNERHLRHATGIMDLTAHPAPFTPPPHVVAGATDTTSRAPRASTDAVLSKLFLLDAALAPALDAVEAALGASV